MENFRGVKLFLVWAENDRSRLVAGMRDTGLQSVHVDEQAVIRI